MVRIRITIDRKFLRMLFIAVLIFNLDAKVQTVILVCIDSCLTYEVQEPEEKFWMYVF